MNNAQESLVGIVLLLLSCGTVCAYVMSRRRESLIWRLCAFGGVAAVLLLITVAFLAEFSARPVRHASLVRTDSALRQSDARLIAIDLNRSARRSQAILERARLSVDDNSSQTTPPERPDTGHPRLFGGGTAWLAEVDQEFDADVHPSARFAAKALGRKVKTIIDTTVDQVNETIESPIETEFSIIQISGSTGQHPATDLVLGDLAAVLREKFKSAKVMVESAPLNNEIQDFRAISIAVDVPDSIQTSKAAWGTVPSQTELSGSLRANVRWRFGNFLTTARFVEKPWVTNFSEYLSTRPHLQRL